MDAPDDKAVLRASLRRGECMSIETLVAIPAEEARKLIKKWNATSFFLDCGNSHSNERPTE
jgi:hypothetical protein